MAATELSLRLLRDPGHFIALGAGTGLAPRAPGTVGTLVGVALYVLCSGLGTYAYLTLVALLFAVGVPLCERTARCLGRHDHPAIVWDECVGYLAAMVAAGGGAAEMVVGFCAFRFFDIVKPWPIRQFDAGVPGGLGIMLDDLIAAVCAALVLEIFKYLSYIYT